jgi:hypothetical protein
MPEFAVFIIVFIYSAILWVAVLIIYSAFIESLDFGRLSTFALKSVILIAIVAAVVSFVPWGGFLTFPLWGLGLIIIMRVDLWEARMLLALLWVVNYFVGLAVRGAMLSAR